MNSTEIIPRQTIADAVNTWTECTDQIRAAFRLLEDADTRLRQTFEGPNRYIALFRIHESRFRGFDSDGAENLVDSMRRDVWAALIDKLELRRFMSTERSNKLDEQLGLTDRRYHYSPFDKPEPLPEITVEHVMSMMNGMLGAIPTMAEESVREVFEILRPVSLHRQRDLKTNSQFEIGKRVILRGWLEPTMGDPRPNYYRLNECRAVDRVFHMLDGQGQVAKTHNGELLDAVNQVSRENLTGETTYFRFRACANGNLHLEFKRPDLVNRLNEIAGGKRLRGERENV